VNLASRVQRATKCFKSDLLVTGTTYRQLDSSFDARRLCRVRLVNIDEPVDLYELVPPDRPGWEVLRRGYEEALDLFEGQEFRRAARALSSLLVEFPEDDPALLLLARAVECMVEEPREFGPVWVLPVK
jgi:adenylate cyclase